MALHLEMLLWHCIPHSTWIKVEIWTAKNVQDKNWSAGAERKELIEMIDTTLAITYKS